TVPETGGTVTYTYTLTNTSPAGVFDPLTLTSLVDDKAGDILASHNTFTGDDGDGLLEAGETWVFTKSQAIPPGDATGGSYTNTVTVNAKDNENHTTSDTDSKTVTYTDVAPSIDIVKTVSSPTVPETGGTVTYTYTLTNTCPAGVFDPLTLHSLPTRRASNLLASHDTFTGD